MRKDQLEKLIEKKITAEYGHYLMRLDEKVIDQVIKYLNAGGKENKALKQTINYYTGAVFLDEKMGLSVLQKMLFSARANDTETVDVMITAMGELNHNGICLYKKKEMMKILDAFTEADSIEKRSMLRIVTNSDACEHLDGE